jgi:hypothetical protein
MSQSEFSFSEHLQSPRENSYPGGTRENKCFYYSPRENLQRLLARGVDNRVKPLHH